jgi:hypothetical protein
LVVSISRHHNPFGKFGKLSNPKEVPLLPNEVAIQMKSRKLVNWNVGIKLGEDYVSLRME